MGITGIETTIVGMQPLQVTYDIYVYIYRYRMKYIYTYTYIYILSMYPLKTGPALPSRDQWSAASIPRGASLF